MYNKKVVLIARIVLGSILLIFGLNKFLNFMPALELTGPSADFFGALIGSGYLFPLIGLVEILTGVALLNNRFVALGLVIMAPVTVNFMAFHLFLDLSPNMGPAILVFTLQLYLLFAYIDVYRPLLQAKQ